MKLIRKLGTRFIWNKWTRYGIFLCPCCFQEIECTIKQGLRNKSCGCQKNKLISESNKGKKHTKEHNEKVAKALLGKKKSEEHKQNIAKAREGKKFKPHTDETNLKISLGNKGKIVTEETRQKQSKARIDRELSKGKNNPMYGIHRYGKENPNWNNGSSFEPYSPEFNSDLKQQILERDDYTCQCSDCEHKSSKLYIHHIDYDKNNNNNNNKSNLITLCNSCHSKTNGKNKRTYWTNYYTDIMEDKC